MQRIEPERLDPMGEVYTEPLETASGAQTNKLAVMMPQLPTDDYKDPKPVVVGFVSRDYNLIPNRDVVHAANEIVSAMDGTFEDGGILWDGRRFRQRWVFPDISVEPKVGDVVRMCLDIFNSYDGTMAISGAFNAQRLVCENGMVTDFMLGGFRLAHFGENGNGEFKRELEEATAKLQKAAPDFQRLGEIISILIERPATLSEARVAFNATQLPDRYAFRGLMGMEEDTCWDLYNGVTQQLSEQRNFGAENWNRRWTQFFFQNLVKTQS